MYDSFSRPCTPCGPMMVPVGMYEHDHDVKVTNQQPGKSEKERHDTNIDNNINQHHAPSSMYP